MDILVEVSNEDRLAQPHTPHMFAIPRLMNNLWRSQLSKDTEVLFTINVGPSCWTCSIHEPIIVLIFLPLDHVSNYRGPWVLRGISQALEVQNHLEAGFKHPDLHGCGNFITWKCPCMECETSMSSGVGLFCSYFVRLRKPFPPCYAVWCGEFYRPHPEDPFRVNTSLAARDNKSKDLETEERLNKRLRIAKYRDRLMGILFECDLCQFRNVN